MTDLERIELAARRSFEEILMQPQMDVARAFQIFAGHVARVSQTKSELEKPMAEHN